MSVFDESTLEQAIIDKLVSEGYSYVSGDNLHRELTDVIIEEDLTEFLIKISPSTIFLNIFLFAS